MNKRMNKKMRVFTGMTALVMTLSSFAFAGYNSTADFLKVPVGARGVAMSRAYTALAHSAESLYWNTAGISDLKQNGALILSHQELFEENQLDALGLAMPFGGSSSNLFWGLSAARLSYPDQEGRDASRAATGSFKSQDTVVGLALAKNWSGFRLGTQLKVIQQEIASDRARGYAVDMGLLLKSPIRRLSVGMAVRNLGPRMNFIEEGYHLPLTISVGSAYQLGRALSLSLDAVARPHQDQVSFSFGTEFVPMQMIALRAGYLARVAQSITNSQTDETNRGDFGNLNGLSGGVGLQMGRFSLDYAFTPMGELGNTQTLSLNTQF